MILGTPIEPLARFLLNRPKSEFHSGSFWDKLYRENGRSGYGSYGSLAEFKAKILNEFVEKKQIETVIEFGCGDGNQLSLADYPDYIGFDVSETAVELCKNKFGKDSSKQFRHISEFNSQVADLSLSLDVIYHLIEDEVFEQYMSNLFSSSKKYVVIYSSNYDQPKYPAEWVEVKHRKFTQWIVLNAKNFSQTAFIKNEFPYDESDPDHYNTSWSDFYFFKKT